MQFEVDSEPSEFRWIERSTTMNESSGRSQVAKINRESGFELWILWSRIRVPAN